MIYGDGFVMYPDDVPRRGNLLVAAMRDKLYIVPDPPPGIFRRAWHLLVDVFDGRRTMPGTVERWR